ncbi:dsRBD fold-containing protein [Mycolicibacterium sp.]|uniref:dsRBD fold-containing protein n=1 Tax=Mycolicibacterium sp. TaxID=2320850 RepID=UPI001A1E6BA0|nr:dsRBD fold-containing protein [Mycolicibacterium sp.]MBJ7338108.1 DUF1876 family protein [Mycolicibacterium sp.]
MNTKASTVCVEMPTLTIDLDEYDQHSRAIVRLDWHATNLVGRGLSRLDSGREVQFSIGQKLALARALSHLVRQLFTEAARDIEALSGPRSV